MNKDYQYEYEVVPDWLDIPEEYAPKDVCGLAVDYMENVYVLNRGKYPFLMLNSGGKLIKTWGTGEFTRAHDICISPDGHVWCVDDDNHCVRKYTPDGELCQIIGTPGQPSDTGVVGKDDSTIQYSAGPFCYPTGIAFHKKTGEFFVTDGYGNARVHRFSPDGELISSFGKPGGNPGEFRLPHSIAIGDNGFLYVVDRENDRIQLFEPDGKVVAVWEDVVYRPQGIAIDGNGNIFVIELGYKLFNTIRKPVSVQPRARVTILSPDGKVISRIGESDEIKSGSLHWSHAVAVSPCGNLYTGEVVLTLNGWCPPEVSALQKFVKI